MNVLYCVTQIATASGVCASEIWGLRKPLLYLFTSNGPLKKANKLQVNKDDCGWIDYL